jgi:hypothetical protein
VILQYPSYKTCFYTYVNWYRPYVYSPTIILRCFIVRVWFRLDSNRSLHHFLCLDLPYNRKILKVCGLSLSYLPSRQIFDRRLKAMSTDIKERLAKMGNLFVSEYLAKPYILATDSTLLKSKGHVWHAYIIDSLIIFNKSRIIWT